MQLKRFFLFTLLAIVSATVAAAQPTIVNEAAKLLASDGAADDLLGQSVGVSGDTVVVGARGDDDNGSVSGSAYVFEKPAGGWAGILSQAAKLLASDGAAGDELGVSIAVSGDTVVVGAHRDDDNGSSSGSAYVFEKPAGGWAGTLSQAAKLMASDGAADDQFAFSIAVSGDTIVVGAPGNDDSGSSSGSAYVFEKPAGGWAGTLSEAAKLLASDDAADDQFGFSIAVSGDTVVVGARWDDDNGSRSGSAYAFEKPAGGWSGTLNEDAKLLPSDGAADDFFGYSPGVAGDTVVVGSVLDDDNGSNSGSAYVFEKPAGGWTGTLNETAKLLASDGAASEQLGFITAVSGDTVVAGANLDDDNGPASGSAYVFEKPAGGWAGTLNETAKLLASDGEASELLGFAVSVSGGTLVAAAVLDDDNGTSSGSAYVFELTCTDTDNDGYGSPGSVFCTNGDAEDCNDTDVSVFPGATEVCDGVDNNCSGGIDEGFDLDGDLYTTCAGDCNDGDVAINPGAAEVCDAVDNNCDGTVDEGTPDGDGDLVCDGVDNCPIDANPGQENCDAGTGDTKGDVCDDDDTDNDGLTDADEIWYAGGICPGGCPDPVDNDSDNDGLLDGFESDVDPDKNCDFCDSDTDDDGEPDASDPFCNDPTLTGDCAQDLADFEAYILSLPTSVFQAPGANTEKQREQTRANLAKIIGKAAKHLDKCEEANSVTELGKTLGRVDGAEPPLDDMVTGSAKKAIVLETIEDFLYLFDQGVCGC